MIPPSFVSFGRPVVRVVLGVNFSHRLLARLLLGHMRDESRRAGGHEDAVEDARVESQVGEDRAERAGPRLSGAFSRSLRMPAPSRQPRHVLQRPSRRWPARTARRARVGRVDAVTEAGHPRTGSFHFAQLEFCRLLPTDLCRDRQRDHRRDCARESSIAPPWCLLIDMIPAATDANPISAARVSSARIQKPASAPMRR